MDERNDLRKQLEQEHKQRELSDRELEKCYGSIPEVISELKYTQEQLAEARKDADNCERRVDELTNDLAEAQAECERLRDELDATFESGVENIVDTQL